MVPDRQRRRRPPSQMASARIYLMRWQSQPRARLTLSSVAVGTMLAASANARWMSWRRSVHGDTVGVGGFADRLEEGGATGRAVSAASGCES
jgi:hypothetical protein